MPSRVFSVFFFDHTRNSSSTSDVCLVPENVYDDVKKGIPSPPCMSSQLQGTPRGHVVHSVLYEKLLQRRPQSRHEQCTPRRPGGDVGCQHHVVVATATVATSAPWRSPPPKKKKQTAACNSPIIKTKEDSAPLCFDDI